MSLERETRPGAMVRSFLALSAVVLAVWGEVGVAVGADRFSGWEFRQEMQLPVGGAVRVVLPVEALGLCRPGLEDLRLADPAGGELAYGLFQLDPGPVESVGARGFEVNLGGDSTRVEIDTGVVQPISGITLTIPTARFYKGVRIEMSNDRRRWETLTEGSPLFRLPEEGVSRLLLPMGGRVVPYLRLTFDDRRSRPVPVTAVTVHRAEADPIPLETVEARIVDRTEGASESRLTLDLGAANLFIESLSLQTGEPLFSRRVSVILRELEQGVLRERVLMEGQLFRLAGESESIVSQLEFPVRQRIPARRVEVVIQNGDSPVLPVSAASARRRPDQMVCSLPGPGVYALYSGNRDAALPRYDLGGVSVRARKVPVAAGRFGSVVSNPSFFRSDGIPEFPALGGALPVDAWKFRKPVQLAGAGMQQLELDLETLSGALPGLEDLRLMSEGRQVPYLLEYLSLTRAVAPRVSEEPVRDAPRLTRWRLELPATRLPLTRLTVASTTPLFERDLRLWQEQVGGDGNKHERELGRARWVRAPGAGREMLTLTLSSPPIGNVLFLETDNADNAPIELHDLRFVYPVTRLVFRPAEGKAISLSYGNPAAAAPRYDLGLVAGSVLRAERSSASLGAEERLTGGNSFGDAFRGGGGVVIFWAVLITVVIALLVIVSRLLPKPPAEG